MDSIAPRLPKRLFSGSDDERSLKKLARHPELEFDGGISSDDDSVYSYQDCPTVILGSSSDEDEISDGSLSEDSDDELRGITTQVQDGVDCIVFEAGDSHSDDGVESFFADESSDTGEASDLEECSNGGLFSIVPRKQQRPCLRCGRKTENVISCDDCWQDRKVKVGLPPRRRKKCGDFVDRRPPIAPENLCAICCVEPKTMTLVHGDTAHECVCYDCAGQLLAQTIPKRRCPVCREIFTSVKVNRRISDYRRKPKSLK